MKTAKRIRLWPAIVILALGAATVLWLQLAGGRSGQERFVFTLMAGFLTLVALVLWLLFLSRLPWRRRLAGLGLVVLALVGFRLMVRVQGVSGDLVPIFTWQWAADPDTRLELPEPALAPPATLAASPFDYPRFLGANGDATVRGVRLARDWAARPPRLVWRRPVGAGWSSFAVVGEVAVTQEQRGEDELVVAYDLATGEVLWTHADRGRYDTTIAGIGPRANPTIADGRVYTVGALGRLNCLDLATGERLWTRDILADNGAANPEWGKSCSPLVLDDLVVVSAGGPAGRSLVAYDRETGEPVWGGGNDRSGYASPWQLTLAGVPQIVIFNRGTVAGHSPASGELLWSYPWPAEQPNVAQPLPLPGDRLLVSSGYGIGSKLLRIRRAADGALEPELLWESPRLKAKFTNVVLHEGRIYGLDDGVLVCLDPATGERCWKRGRYGHGQVLLVEDLLLVQAENGEVVLVEPDPEEPVVLGRFQALEGKTWNNPALAGRYLLVRNDQEAACYELPLAGA